MAKQKKDAVETSTATLDSGAKVTGPKAVIDRLTGAGSSTSGTTSDTSTKSTRSRTSTTE